MRYVYGGPEGRAIYVLYVTISYYATYVCNALRNDFRCAMCYATIFNVCYVLCEAHSCVLHEEVHGRSSDESIFPSQDRCEGGEH